MSQCACSVDYKVLRRPGCHSQMKSTFRVYPRLCEKQAIYPAAGISVPVLKYPYGFGNVYYFLFCFAGDRLWWCVRKCNPNPPNPQNCTEYEVVVPQGTLISTIVTNKNTHWVKSVCIFQLVSAYCEKAIRCIYAAMHSELLFLHTLLCAVWWYCVNCKWLVSELLSWCFKPSQPQRILPGLKETFIKRYIVERTNKALIRPEDQSEKAELLGEFMKWNTVESAMKTETDTRTEQTKKRGVRFGWFMSTT